LLVPYLRVELIPDGLILARGIHHMLALAISETDSLSFSNLVLQGLIHPLLILLDLAICIVNYVIHGLVQDLGYIFHSCIPNGI
jgi:hypothetical protein